jgi:collagenase-like PrtC family protease
MKFAVGYQQSEPGEESFVDVVTDYRDHLAEIYFPWGQLPSGRAALTVRRGYVNWSGQRQLEEDLRRFRQMGLGLDLLFNSNCYGGQAVSQSLENLVISVLDHLGEVCGGVDAVTTTSLAVARTVKKGFPQVEVRASVNMRIGAAQAMGYVAPLFDAFYIQREHNRDLAGLRDLRRWADAHGKKLYLLANSGCLYACPGQTFHDNLVAHDREVDEAVNIPDWTPHVCWGLYRDRAKWPAILQATWIRPEDLSHYEELFRVVKLATRMHSRPRMVVDSYIRRRHRGNLLDLFEPAFSPAFAPEIIDNDKFPADWLEKTSTCGHHCTECRYCADALVRVLSRVSEG